MRMIIAAVCMAAVANMSSAIADTDITSLSIPSGDVRIQTRMELDSEKERFNIFIESNDSTDLCIDETLWPSNGTIDNCPPLGQVRLFLLQNGRVIPYGIELCSECVPTAGVGSDCKIRIRPGQTISGFLHFKDFAGSIVDDGSAKQTIFLPNRPYYCRQKSQQ
jgi:hypothetical protein